MSEVIVRRYQLRRPIEFGKPGEIQIRLQREMWNRLVELDQEFRARFDALTSGSADVQAAAEATDALVDERIGLIAERKARYRRARTKAGVDVSDIDARLAELKPLISAARKHSSETKRAAREAKRGGQDVLTLRARLSAQKKARAGMLAQRDGAEPPSKDDLAAARSAVEATKSELDDLYAKDPDTVPAVEAARERRVIEIRQEFAGKGLFWGSYNAVLASYERGRKRAIATGAALKFHGPGDRARIVTQVQGGMTVGAFLAGSKAQVGARKDACRVESGRRAPRMRELSVRLDGDDARGKWPMLLSRPIPDDAMIKEVVVTRRRIGSHSRWAAVVTATKPAGVSLDPPTGPAVAIDLGWRLMADGIRVATFLAVGSPKADHVILPSRILAMWDRCDVLRSSRDDARNVVLATLLGLRWSSAPEAIAEFGQSLRLKPKASSAGTLARLERLWREHEWQTDTRRILAAWRRWDKGVWEEEANLRDHAQAARLDLYRKEAARIAGGAGTIVLEDFDLATVARVENQAGDQNPLPLPARRLRTIAAPSELRKWIDIQAQKRRVPIMLHQSVDPRNGQTVPARSNAPHVAPGCGAIREMPDPKELQQRCPACGKWYDQDENACRVMLAAHLSSSSATPLRAGPLAAE